MDLGGPWSCNQNECHTKYRDYFALTERISAPPEAVTKMRVTQNIEIISPQRKISAPPEAVNKMNVTQEIEIILPLRNESRRPHQIMVKI